MAISTVQEPDEILHRVLSGSVSHDIYQWLDELREAQPIIHSEAYGGWYVLRYDAVSELLRSPDFHMATAHYLAPQHPSYGNSTYMQGLKNLFPFMLPDDHARVRRLVVKALTPRIVRTNHRLFEEATDLALDAVAELDQFDIHETVSTTVPGYVMFRLMGVPYEDVTKCLEWTEAMAAASDPVVTDEQLRTVDRAMVEFSDYVLEMTERRRRQPTDDIVSGLIRAEQEEGVLSRGEFYGTVMALIVGGISLTQGLLSSGIVCLLNNPDQRDLFLRRPDLAGGLVEETLRYQTPLQLSFARIAVRDLRIADTEIAKGEVCYGMLGSANFDPTVFDAPHEFRIDRPSRPAHLGLGLGSHFCVGAALGRAEGTVAFRKIFERMPDLELVEQAPPWRDGFMVRQNTRCPVRRGRSRA